MPTTTETAASIHERFEATALPLHDSIYRANLRMTGDPVMAQDLTQETYLRAFRAFDSFQAGTNCRAWMLQISHNLFCRDYRGRKRITYRTAADDDVDVLAQFRADVPTRRRRRCASSTGRHCGGPFPSCPSPTGSR
jgi:RNA polymerase sigma-70 factor (ECF subfamily)